MTGDGPLTIVGALRVEKPAHLETLLKRLATLVPTLVFVSMLIFGLQQLLPGDPAKILAGEDQDPSVVAHLRAKLHLDDAELDKELAETFPASGAPSITRRET